ncbi:uncharacterized protein LOC112597507 [Melanaphis sacchari]|uniref:uncharacterized protein LOC112597507 n=1 Tax=Melanaphis sacchari TaxID=742174 RepID=UPI000DC14463|nr:uncharacterized protein LOC112597507 [Melanaphis sacchari]
MTTKTKSVSKENILDIGWNGKIDHYLSNIVPNGIVKIKNGNSMTQFNLEIQKNYIREMIKQSTEMMKQQKEFELELVLKNKMSPLTANKSVLKHPVVAQRLKAKRLIEFNKEKPKKHYSRTYVKKFEKVQCENIPSEVEQMGIKFRELKFGESCVFDYYKHGKHLKQKMNEHNKEIGLHLPRSNFQVKINDEKLNSMTKMNINNIQDTAVPMEGVINSSDQLYEDTVMQMFRLKINDGWDFSSEEMDTSDDELICPCENHPNYKSAIPFDVYSYTKYEEKLMPHVIKPRFHAYLHYPVGFVLFCLALLCNLSRSTLCVLLASFIVHYT